jgi:hypothetical protein
MPQPLPTNSFPFLLHSPIILSSTLYSLVTENAPLNKLSTNLLNVGAQGSISDGGVFNHTSLFAKLIKNTLNIPQPPTVSAREMRSPFVIFADDAFPLTKNILKPFPGSHEKGSV